MIPPEIHEKIMGVMRQTHMLSAGGSVSEQLVFPELPNPREIRSMSLQEKQLALASANLAEILRDADPAYALDHVGDHPEYFGTMRKIQRKLRKVSNPILVQGA